MPEEAVPRILVSRCIEHEACRWNGLIIRSDAVKLMRPLVEFVAVCPEMECGLGCPRDPVRVVQSGDDRRLIQPTSGRDCTEEMENVTARLLGEMEERVDGFILKSRSPSCGTREVKIYARPDSRGARRKGAGLFGGEVVARFGHLPVEDEGRLRNYSLREDFLTSVWTLARFRAARRTGRMRALVRFHAEHKLLLQARSEKRMRALGRTVANQGRGRTADVFAEYGAGLCAALRRPPSVKGNINVLQHAMGHFKRDISGAEKTYFLQTLESYREGRVPLSAVVSVIRAWSARFGEAYIAGQRFFEPYPGELVSVSDSGTGRRLR